MNDMKKDTENGFVEIRTVSGKKKISKSTLALSHEHICCYSEYLYMMSKGYLNKDALAEKAAAVLRDMKKTYGLGLFLDCTPLNIGRDVELLKKVSERSGVDIVCSTGFYYGYEPIPNCMSAETLAAFIEEDARGVCAGMIKAAVEDEELSDFNIKLLRACALAQRKTGLPIVLHTNAINENGRKAVAVLLEENVPPERIVVGHLSDTDSVEYIEEFANLGCYIALDRMYENKTEEYISSKVKQITRLCGDGFEKQLLLSHDDAVFQGFCEKPTVKEPRWRFVFEHILPKLDEKTAARLMKENPLAMLCGE